MARLPMRFAAVCRGVPFDWDPNPSFFGVDGPATFRDRNRSRGEHIVLVLKRERVRWVGYI